MNDPKLDELGKALKDAIDAHMASDLAVFEAEETRKLRKAEVSEARLAFNAYLRTTYIGGRDA